MNRKLPSWAQRHSDGRVEVDPDVVYPLFLGAIGYEGITQEALETCRMVITRHLHDINDSQLRLVITYRPKWALRNYPKGVALDHVTTLSRLKTEGRMPE